VTTGAGAAAGRGASDTELQLASTDSASTAPSRHGVRGPAPPGKQEGSLKAEIRMHCPWRRRRAILQQPAATPW